MASVLPLNGNDNGSIYVALHVAKPSQFVPHWLYSWQHISQQDLLVAGTDATDGVQNSVYTNSVKIVLLKTHWQFYGRLKKKKEPTYHLDYFFP